MTTELTDPTTEELLAAINDALVTGEPFEWTGKNRYVRIGDVVHEPPRETRDEALRGAVKVTAVFDPTSDADEFRILDAIDTLGGTEVEIASYDLPSRACGDCGMTQGHSEVCAGFARNEAHRSHECPPIGPQGPPPDYASEQCVAVLKEIAEHVSAASLELSRVMVNTNPANDAPWDDEQILNCAPPAIHRAYDATVRAQDRVSALMNELRVPGRV